jgi:hypothetical protein
VRRAIAVAALLAACGGDAETVPVQVSLGLDESSCLTTDPAAVHFSCATSVGVWVREVDTDGFAGTIIEQACVDLPGPDATLSSLPQVLSTVDLDGLSDRAVILEMAVTSPGTASEGCPTLDDFPLEILVWGETSPIVLSAADGALDLELFCEIYQDTSCADDCEVEYETCVAEPVGPCDTAYDTCTAGCVEGDAECLSLCDEQYNTCLADNPDGEEQNCEAANQTCYQQCDKGGGLDDCYTACDTDYTSCVEARCDTARTECVAVCDPGDAAADSCIAVD